MLTQPHEDAWKFRAIFGKEFVEKHRHLPLEEFLDASDTKFYLAGRKMEDEEYIKTYALFGLANPGELYSRNLDFLRAISARDAYELFGITVMEESIERTYVIVDPPDFMKDTRTEWVKWTEEQPDWNGSVYLAFNGKNRGDGIVNNKFLLKIMGQDTEYTVKDGKIHVDYTPSQLELLDTVYWLREKHPDAEAWERKHKLFFGER